MSSSTYTSLPQKDRLAFLQERFSQQLKGYAIHQWKLTEDEAWDLIYATFLEMSKLEQPAFENNKHLKNYLFRAFINRLKNYLQRNKSKEIVDYREDLTSIQSATETAHANSIEALALEEALDRMEDWQRMLLLLRAQGMPYKEIGKYVDKPHDQLKVYYQRLKKELEKELIKQTKSIYNEH